MKKFILRAAAVCALLVAPAIAQAAEGFATANVNMRSGPSTRYPAVSMIPVGESVEIHGCLADLPWCDVSFYGGRGWVAGRYVQADYRRNRVYVEPRYYRPLGIPTVVFQFDSYWDRNYRGRDFYRDRDRWRRGPDWVDDRRDRRDWERQRERDRRDWERDRRKEQRDWERRQRDEDKWRDDEWRRQRTEREDRRDWERRSDGGVRVRQDDGTVYERARPAPMVRCQIDDPYCEN
ncbi:SH3 domain-containing protein [Ensifer sp. PDNC004]|uniref:SH3 domain-containing protein n=1 Tax=Ensifer sp. PDNC004 TaxID=2811423 RepID=UPI0019651D1C|nr:SH3 domain-containing protein [Ensifer sp. PDNC004]QRY69854.1 SH3 domain-containing protein [Ensifer sp. PDNC004]